MSFISEVESSIRVLFDSISSGFQMDPSAGYSQIDNWIQHLRSTDEPALRPIAQELVVDIDFSALSRTSAFRQSLPTEGDQLAITCADSARVSSLAQVRFESSSFFSSHFIKPHGGRCRS